MPTIQGEFRYLSNDIKKAQETFGEFLEISFSYISYKAPPFSAHFFDYRKLLKVNSFMSFSKTFSQRYINCNLPM